MTQQDTTHDGAAVTDVHFLDRQLRALCRMLVEEERHLNAIRADVSDADGQAGRAQGVNEPGELSQLLVTRVDGESLVRRSSVRIEAIEAALARIDDGSYGHCERCGEEIENERLEALPDVTLCTTCKSLGTGRLFPSQPGRPA